MSYILKGHWCNIIVLNAHAQCEDKSDHINDSFREDLGRAFDQFPRYEMKILLGDVNAIVGREDIFKLIIKNERSHKISKDNEFRVVNFTSEN
jgi:hypothetical protein